MNKFLIGICLISAIAFSFQATPARYGYYIDANNNYQKCTAKANTCDKDGALSCITGYTLANKACSISITTSLTCTQTTVTTSAGVTASLGSFYYNTGDTYKDQEIKCFNCPSYTTCDGTPLNYKSCTGNYWYDSDLKICAPCRYGCETCSKYDTCTTCFTNYAVMQSDKKTCKYCSDYVAHCATCDTNGKCTQCSAPYYLSDNKCVQCGSHCASCSAADQTCQSCDSTGYKITDKTCTACSVSNCYTCNNDIAKCQACNSGYYLENDTTCTKGNIANCAVYKNTGDCQTCSTGYIVHADSKSCDACGMTNCATCAVAGSGGCDSCLAGYYPSSSGACSAIPSHCRYADNAGKCLICEDYYYVSGTTCIANTQCPLGYYKSGNSCKACYKNCLVCTSSKSIYCDPAYKTCDKFSFALSAKFIFAMIAALLFLF